MTKSIMATLLRRDAKKRGLTFKECSCCHMYGYVPRNSSKDTVPVIVKPLKLWYYEKLVTESNNS